MIEDFIPEYPTILEKSFSEKLFGFQEFNELKLSAGLEEKPAPGELLNSQEIIKRFMNEYATNDRMLICADTGTGKTCKASAVIETFKNVPVDGRIRKPALVLVPSTRAIENFQNEVVNVCTTNVYNLDTFSGDEKQVKKSIRQLIASTYDIIAWTGFFKNIAVMSNEAIVREYSNRIIVIDECHQLVTTDSAAFDEAEPQDESLDKYKECHRFLHLVEHCRVLFLSATPIWDHTYEIAQLMNLLCDMNNQVPIKKAFMKEFYDSETRKLIPHKESELIAKWYGKIDVLKYGSSSNRLILVGQNLYPPELRYFRVFGVETSSLQQQVLNQIRDVKEEGGLSQESRDASFFIYGDETYGKSAFIKHCVPKGKQLSTIKRFSDYYFDPATLAIVENPQLLKIHSPKIWAILENLKKYPTEKAYLYFRGTYSEAILFGMILVRRLKYRFVNADSANLEQEHPNFTILSSGFGTVTKSPDMYKILDIFNSPRNATGKYLRIIIGTELSSHQYTFRDVRQFHYIDGHWNFSDYDQALGRINRFHSLSGLPVSEQYIRVYRYCMISDDEESKELYIYSVAEGKDVERSSMYRLLMRIAPTCPLEYLRNVSGGQDYSKECNYEKCEFDCIAIDPSLKQPGVGYF